MSETLHSAPSASAEEAPRRYHHGDLSRALVAAGRQILERDGPDALSLRAVAREAGVSPAAPYHHFKDKAELLEAVAHEGWEELGGAIKEARGRVDAPGAAPGEIGVAYVTFARKNPALYRIMYRMACDREAMPEGAKSEDSGWAQVRAAIIEAGVDPHDERAMMLTQIAAWCTAHGVAEMAGFKEFDSLKAALGGEEAFIREVFRHVGVMSGRRSPS
jgi:AcrR family transcriptional regulator